jgi:outer membrane protein TolC
VADGVAKIQGRRFAWAALCAALLAPSMALAQAAPAAPTLSLEDTIRMTLRKSNDAIRIEDEKVNGAAARLKQASGAFDWMVSGEGGYQTLYVPRVAQGLLPNGQGVLTNQTDTVGTGYVSGGIGRTFRNGISVRPGVTAYPSSGASVAQTMGLTQWRPSLGLQIPLLRGLGETAADAVERAAQETLRGTSLARDFAIASLVNDTVQIYWRCLATDQVARNSMTFDQRASDYEASLEKLAGKGLLEPTIAQRAKAMAVSRRVSVEQARNAAQDCRRELASATGAPSGEAAASPGALPAMEPLGGTLGTLQEEALVTLALQNRADYKAADENVAAAAAKLEGARDSTAPTVNLAIEPDRAIVRFSQSIQNNVGEGLAEEAVAASSQAKIALSQLQSQIRQQVSVTLRNLKTAYADWQALSEAARQMDVVVIDAGGRANLGIIDRNDYINTQSQLTDIRNQAVNAQLQVLSSLATLRLMTGTVNPAAEAPTALAGKFLSPAIRD